MYACPMNFGVLELFIRKMNPQIVIGNAVQHVLPLVFSLFVNLLILIFFYLYTRFCACPMGDYIFFILLMINDY